MIQVEGVTKEFGSGKNKKTVLDNVGFSVSNGSVVGLFGEKDSGKSVALRVITGIQSPLRGRVLLSGQDIEVDPIEARRAFGYVPDSTDQFQGLTGTDYLNFIADIYDVGTEDRKEFIESYSARLKTEIHLKERMSSYSKSIYKKVMLMGAMIYQPENLILDDLLQDIDKEDVDEVKKVIREYAKKGNAVLMSEEKLRYADGFCDSIVYLKAGKVIFNGRLSELEEQYSGASSLEIIELILNEAPAESVRAEKDRPKIKLWGGI